MRKSANHMSHVQCIELIDGGFRTFRREPASSMKRRTTYGREVGNELLDWLCGLESEGQKRIDLILQLIVKLRNLSLEPAYGPERLFFWQGQTFIAKRPVGSSVRASSGERKKAARQSDLISELNHQLHRYKVRPQCYDALSGRLVFGWWSGSERPPDEDDSSEDVLFTEEDAIIRILQLAQENLLARITRCDCGDWFFARTNLNKYCCTRCQQRFYKMSPEWRAKRNVYMKELRAKHKKTYFPAPKKTKITQRKAN
jgi:hypothetical protein